MRHGSSLRFLPRVTGLTIMGAGFIDVSLIPMCAALGLSIFTSFPTTRLGTSGNNIQRVEKKARIKMVYGEWWMVKKIATAPGSRLAMT